MNTSPFKFLDSYGKEDAATFFGREPETDELYARCTHAQTLVIYGRSGTGKTSLVQCGLRSRFDESDWLPITIRRGTDLNESLIAELRNASLTTSKSNDPLELVRNVYLDHFVPVYLLFDQFEEIFIFGDQEEQQQFISTVRTLIDQEQHVHLLFITREEYLAQFTVFEEQVPSILEHRMRVERMPRRRAVDVVEKLCAAEAIPTENGFATALMDRLNTDGGGVELSYLQVMLDQCWKKREGEEPFSVALLERIGQLEDVLGDLVDDQIRQCADPRKTEALLKAFVSDQGTKRPLTDPEAEGWMKATGQALEPTDLQRLLQELVDRRLLTERDESGRHELRHDALAARIFERISKVEKEVADVRAFVAQAHKQFTKRGQRLSRADLDYLRIFKHQLHLAPEQEAFVADAFDEERAREKRKRTKRRLVTAGFLVVLTGLTFFAYRLYTGLMREQAINESSRLVQRSEAIVDSDPQSAYLLAERAVHLDRTLGAERALMRAYNSLFTEVARFPGTSVLVAPDHKTFVSIDHYKSFSLCDTNGKVIFTQELVRPPLVGVEYVAAGHYLLNVDSTVHLFDLQGNAVFQCPLTKWKGFTDNGGLMAYYSDSLLVEQNGVVQRFAVPARFRRSTGQAKSSIPFGRLTNGLLYSVDHDSLFLYDPVTSAVQRAWPHPPLTEVDGEYTLGNIMGHKDRVYLSTENGLLAFGLDVDGVRLAPPLPMFHMQILDKGLCLRATRDWHSSVLLDLDALEAAPRNFKHFRRYFRKSRTILVNDTGYIKGKCILYDISGKPIMSSSGRLVGKVGDEFLRARDHFVIVSEAGVKEDSIKVFRSNGSLQWSVVVPKISPHLYEERPALTFDEVGDSVTVCYFHNSVINGTSLQECRMIRNGRTIFYTTKEPFYFYWDRFIFNVVGNDRVLLSRFRDGFSLFKPDRRTDRMPTDAFYAVELRPAGVGLSSWNSTVNGMQIEVRLHERDNWRKVQLDTDVPEFQAAMAARSGTNGNFSSDGRIYRQWVWIDSLLYHGRDFLWRTSDGSYVENTWTQGVIMVNQVYEPTEFYSLFRNDSLLVLGDGLAKLAWAVPLDGMRVSSWQEEERYVTTTAADGRVRIIDLHEHTVEEVRIDTSGLDPEIKAFMGTENSPSFYVEGPGVMDIVLRRNEYTLFQRIKKSTPLNRILLRGAPSFQRVGDGCFMTVYNNTMREALSDVESFPNFTRTHYRLDTQRDELVLSPVPASVARTDEYSTNGFGIQKWDDRLLEPGKYLMSNYGADHVITTNRLFSAWEEFPKDPITAIKQVRQDKVYGEFWKYIDTEALFKEE